MVRLDMFACLFDHENSRCRIVSTQGVLKLLKTSWAAMEDFPGAFSLLKKNKEENIVTYILNRKVLHGRPYYTFLETTENYTSQIQRKNQVCLSRSRVPTHPRVIVTSVSVNLYSLPTRVCCFTHFRSRDKWARLNRICLSTGSLKVSVCAQISKYLKTKGTSYDLTSDEKVNKQASCSIYLKMLYPLKINLGCGR